jgi:hypothetical protein
VRVLPVRDRFMQLPEQVVSDLHGVGHAGELEGRKVNLVVVGSAFELARQPLDGAVEADRSIADEFCLDCGVCQDLRRPRLGFDSQ